MRRLAILMAVSLAPAFAADDGKPPEWAYPVNPPDFKPAPDDGTPRRVPDSSASYTLTQIRDLFFAPDWHPQDHPPMPDIVARGRKPAVMACASCHRTDGSGGPENASLAGLPAEYIVQQVRDMKSGARGTALPERAPQRLMIAIAKDINDQEAEAAAAYFSALKPRSAIRVIESETVPKTSVAGWFYAIKPGSESEPLGQRIIEAPENLEQFANRDSRARFVAYVPSGSIQKGRALAMSGPAETFQCGTCHGADLKGLGTVPGIAGRSPSYTVRQLYEFKTGARAGAESAPMKPVVQNLSMDDMIALAAYAASMSP